MNCKGDVDILLVEGASNGCYSAREVLTQERLFEHLHAVNDGEEAMAFLRREGKYEGVPRPRLILLDLKLPEKDGRSLLSELKADPALKFIPVVVMTDSSEKEEILRVYGAQASSCITKPREVEEFKKVIASLGEYWLECVTLPPSSPEPARPPVRAAHPPPLGESTTLRVLLLEDCQVDVLFLRQALKRSRMGEFTLTHISRISQLEETLQNAEFDVVITDLGLPDAEGLDTYRRVRMQLPHLPVIVLTGELDESVGIRSLREGAQDYLVKGEVSARALARAIRYAIDRKTIEDELRHSQRMEAVGHLAGGIAHDFNNVLTVVQGEAVFLSEGELTREEIREAGLEILNASKRAEGLTRQLLAFSRRKPIQLCPHDLNEAVQDFERIIRRVLGENISLMLELHEGRVPVMCDLGMLEQVLLNLTINARDAMPRGGLLRLKTGKITLPAKDTNGGGSAQEYAFFSVADNGVGIGAKNISRIFDPFFTTKEIGKGTGLGLATAYSIVQQHGGRIQVRSRLDEGTEFDICIPLSKTLEDSEPESAETGAPKAASCNETVLVVDDEDSLRALAIRFLKKSKYEVLEAGNGVEAREILSERGNEINLLFTDLMMPGGVGGRQLAEEFATQLPHLAVIFTSGYSVDFGDSEFELKEGENFLQKPFNFTKFLNLIRRRLDEAKANLPT